MESLAIAIAQHGYSILFTLVLLEALGFPIPAALAILTAGAASAHGPMHPVLSPATALAALFIGDTSLYLLGRYTGWWTLRMLCILSLNPDTCILRSADVFFKRGKIVLLFAKFLPGVNTMAAPLAGSMNMKFGQFFRYDLGGALLYAVVYSTIGYVFSDFLGAMTKSYIQFGHYLGRTLAILFAGYLAWRAWIVIRQRRVGTVNGVTALEVSRNSGQFAVFDVRSHGYYDKGAKRIRGSARLEPNAIGNAALDFPKDKKIVLYCT
ncbi:MAG TPA: VTT domain-containing protein [Bryobacteraceae bacterium]|nr:VTT domain-containing protein [Bryobacteraceae bacterium]